MAYYNEINGLYYNDPNFTQPAGDPNGATAAQASSATASAAPAAPTPSYLTPAGVATTNPTSVNQYAGPFSNTNATSTAQLAQASIYSSAPAYTPMLDTQGPGSTQNVIEGTMLNQANPTLSTLGVNATQTAIPIQSGPEDIQTYKGPAINRGYDAAAASSTSDLSQAGLQQGQVTQAGEQSAQAAANTNTNLNTGQQNLTYNPTLVNAAQGTVDPNSLVQNQMQAILSGPVNSNGIPEWAQPAVTAAMQQMTLGGLGNSTLAADATVSAILTTALPMAQQNAQTYAAINSQNLANQQQTLLSNQAAANAAAQFNSQNETQNNQFFQQLASSISMQNQQQSNAMAQFNAAQFNSTAMYNAGQANAMSQFNVGQFNTQQQFNAAQANTVGQFNAQQLNTIAQFNAQQHNAMQQFNASQINAMDQFNAQNQLAVNTSNVNWQRSINTANTAAVNAANNANAQNQLNITQSALNNEWQMLADQASWSLTASENSQNRGLILATSAMNQQTSMEMLSSQMQAQMNQQLGSLAANVLGGAVNGVSNLFSTSSSSSTVGVPGVNDFGGGGSLPDVTQIGLG